MRFVQLSKQKDQQKDQLLAISLAKPKAKPKAISMVKQLAKQIVFTKLGWLSLSVALGVVACASDITMIDTHGTEEDADKLLIVDCLLPGKIKRLGAGATFVTPRRPTKIAALDCESRGGEYVAYEQANSATALKVWLPSAQDGSKVAQTYVGEIYEKGLGIKSDYKLAAKWYLKAATQGHSRAMLNLGYLYEKGLGVTKNLTVALNLYRQASGLSDTDIEFASIIDVENVDDSANELRTLKHELEDEKQQITIVNQQVIESKEQLAKEKAALETQSKKLQDERNSLELEQKQLGQQKVIAASERQKLDQKAQKLNSKEKSINQQLASIEKLMVETPQVPQKMAITSVMPVNLAKLSIAGPSIQLISPQLVNTRGSTLTIDVRQATKTREIIGRINAPAGLQKLTINGEESRIDDKGMFKTLLPIHAKRTQVTILALDTFGKQANIKFDFVQSNQIKKKVVVAPPLINPDSVSGEFGHFYALVIGNNGYSQYSPLSTAINDAKSVADVLSNKYGFKATTLVNANRFMILATLNRLSKRLTEKDNLLIYYAGHGELEADGETGYWIPVDAAKNDKKKWIPNMAISDVINAMKVKRVLVIADSCYSGSLTRSSLPQAKSNVSAAERITWLRAMAKSKSRLALTSGGLQPVSDDGTSSHSLFAHALLNILKLNNRIMEGQRLYNQVYAQMAIATAAKNIDQVPEYAPIRHTGHESGEFFFMPSRGRT